MKTLVCCAFALVTVAGFCEEAATANNDMTPEQRHAEAVQRRYRRSGGTVVKPGSLSGQIVYVNCQKRADQKFLAESVDYFKKETKLDIVIKDGSFDLLSPKVQGSLSLFVVDDAALPPLLFAPESRWAMVNVNPLASGRGEKAAFFEARVKKQLTRGFALLCGASNSQFPGNVVGGVAKVEDLDTYPMHQLPVDVLARFHPYLKAFAVTPAYVTTYRQACKEGWAAQPTNEVEKAIWDEIHELPKNPLKLEK